MMKNTKFKLFLTLVLALIPTIAAYGGYSTFSISQFTDLETILTAAFFLIVFYGFKKILNKVFQNSNAASSFIALVLSIFAVVGLNKMHFSYENFLYGFGISRETLLSIAPWILLGLAIFVFIKWRFAGLFLISSGLFFVLGLLGYSSNGQIVYNWQFSLIISGILFLIGLWLWKKQGSGSTGGRWGPRLKEIKNPLKKGRLVLNVGGRRYYYPQFKRVSMIIPPGRESGISIENAGGTDLIWKIRMKHHTLRANKTRGILSSKQSDEIKIFSDSSSGKKIMIVSAVGRFGKITRQKMSVFIYPK